MLLVLLGFAELASTSQVFDVTKFGAVGDGSADDTAAFQAAFDALGTAPGLM